MNNKHFLISLTKKSVICALFFASLLPFITFAKEPTNLAVYKQALMHYHDSQAYDEDNALVIRNAMSYLKSRLKQQNFNHKKPAIILDIDETSLSNYKSLLKLNFGGTSDDYFKNEMQADDPAIVPTLKLYRFAKAHGIYVIFLTGRFEEEREATEKNLEQAGYTHFDGLILRSDVYRNKPAEQYKTAMREQLIKQGYDIILNVGDQRSDLIGGYADKGFKLSNPFYYIP